MQSKEFIISNSSNETTQRYFFVDYCKAIAIVMIIVFHMNIDDRVNSFLGACQLPVFFFFSGFFLDGKAHSLKNVIIKGIKNLIIPYLLFSFIALLYSWVYPYKHPELYYNCTGLLESTKRGIIGIFMFCDRVTQNSFPPCGPLWFLVALFWCKLGISIWFKPLYQNNSAANRGGVSYCSTEVCGNNSFGYILYI